MTMTAHGSSSSTVVPLTPHARGRYPACRQSELGWLRRGQMASDWPRYGGVYRLDTNPSNWPSEGARPPILPPRKLPTRRENEQVASGGRASLARASRCDGPPEPHGKGRPGRRGQRCRAGSPSAMDEWCWAGSTCALDEWRWAGSACALDQIV